MKEYRFVFSSNGELALVNKITNSKIEECQELKHDIDSLLNTTNYTFDMWRKAVGLIDEDNAEEICFIHIYSNYIFYEGIIAGIKEYDNSKNTRFSIEYRHSPVVLDNNILNRIDIYEKDAYKHFKNKFNDFSNLDTNYYDTDLLYYFFCNVYSCAIEKFKVNFPVETMANISQKYVLDKYVLGNVGKLRKYSEVCEQVKKDVYNLYATFSNMCAGVHTGEVFGLNSQVLVDDFNRRIKKFI